MQSGTIGVVSAYYNENNKDIARWLRELIKRGLIADGEVYERSIINIRPADLAGFVQCHFFAGIGGWSYALRLADWPDDRAVWTGSCPCQPFSSSGTRKGTNDNRHLWPEWFRIIRECRPSVVFGEQVASAIQHGWFDLVFGDLEGVGYACGAAVLGAHSVGAPHIRQRLWFVADNLEQVQLLRELPVRNSRPARARLLMSKHTDVVADRPCQGLEGLCRHEHDRNQSRWLDTQETRSLRHVDLWDDVSFMVCRDGRYRPVPLADGVSRGVDTRSTGHRPTTTVEQRRAVILKGYGNAIVPQVAAAFIEAYMEV